jgi:hypothetical protein
MQLLSILERLLFRNKKSEECILPGEGCRYIFSRKHFSASRVKAAAFLPPNQPNGKTSIFLVSGLNDRSRWSLGEEQVEAQRGESIKARADFHSQVVLSQHLRIDHDGKPHYRHANITGWPDEKSERKLRAQEIANQALLKRR